MSNMREREREMSIDVNYGAILRAVDPSFRPICDVGMEGNRLTGRVLNECEKRRGRGMTVRMTRGILQRGGR